MIKLQPHKARMHWHNEIRKDTQNVLFLKVDIMYTVFIVLLLFPSYKYLINTLINIWIEAILPKRRHGCFRVEIFLKSAL